MERYGHNLTKLAQQGTFSPLVDQEIAVSKVFQVLQRKNTSNPVVVDFDETKQRAVVAEVVRRMAVGDVPALLRTQQVIALNYEAMFTNLSEDDAVDRREDRKQMLSPLMENLSHCAPDAKEKSMIDAWEDVLQRYRAMHFQVLEREHLMKGTADAFLSDISIPLSTYTFIQYLAHSQISLWEAFWESVRTVHADFREKDIFPPLKYLIEHATRIAVLYGEGNAWKSPDKWSYLLQVMGVPKDGSPEYFLLHTPATLEHIKQTEAVLGMPLPPTFVHFLQCSNGLGLTIEEQQFICGVGDARATWNDLSVVSTQPEYHEVAHYWLQWQDVLMYERQRDKETGKNTFRSDEKVCVPFAYAYDDWCFDRAQSNGQGEYPILFWDHELREAGLEYPDFEAWFMSFIIQGKF